MMIGMLHIKSHQNVTASNTCETMTPTISTLQVDRYDLQQGKWVKHTMLTARHDSKQVILSLNFSISYTTLSQT